MVDLRSDTVTKPTDEMRQLIATAKVGDDVLGDDPTIIALQNMISELLDKEAALFVPSGTMSNAIAIRTHTKPGDEIITESTESYLHLRRRGLCCSFWMFCGFSTWQTWNNDPRRCRKSNT